MRSAEKKESVYMKAKRLLTFAFTMAMAFLLVLPVQAASVSFEDVPEGVWYYDAVMACAEKGLVSGVGNNQFAPDKTMTRVEFITVVVRYLYPDTIKNYDGDKSQWWTFYYNIAIQEGLIKTTEFTAADMSVGMSRQEMALVISRALAELGQTPDKIVSSSKIPDYATIGSYYKDAVRVTYTAGIISGTDSSGTFSPMGTLTRGQACTVLYRLTEANTRSPQTGTEDNKQDTSANQNNGDGTVTISSGNNGYGHNSAFDDTRFEQSATHQEWVEGQTHNKPQVGDVVIKADGTRVTLEATEINGCMILGWGANGPQGVDPYTGALGTSGEAYKVGSLAWWDSSRLVKDPATGSVFSTKEWIQIQVYCYPDYDGKANGELGGLNNWYEWWDRGVWNWVGPFFK